MRNIQGIFTGLWKRAAGSRASSAESTEDIPHELRVVPRDQHPISRKNISREALKVLYRLNDAGHDAYLVGGGVRDLLLAGHPKDFDVATSAHPEEVNKLFRNSRLIGRRFKLVHVLFGREVIEVATFRGHHKSDEHSDQQSASNDEGRLLRDNVYGNQEEDALRRDFTINALYYCVKDFSIYDYAGGLQDIESRVVRLIGDPETRYREDPVRMLRAIRFAAKLDFDIEHKTKAPIKPLSEMLTHIPAARLFDEVLKLFLAGKAVRTFEMLREYGLFEALFPQTEARIAGGDAHAEQLVRNALHNTDVRIRQGKPVTPAFLYAALLWPAVQQRWMEIRNNGTPPFPALQQAGQKIISVQTQSTSIPKRFSQPMKEIWELQLRLPKRFGRRAEELVGHPRFRAAYDFVLLRESAGENLQGLGEWWTLYQEAGEDERRKMAQAGGGQGRSRKRRPRRRKPGGGAS